MEDPTQAISETVNVLLDGKSHVKVLDAGCGAASQLRLRAAVNVVGIDMDVVGIDISEEQLQRNAFVQEKIVGDIQTYSLPKEEFDVVVCWWLLEHLLRPREALLNMFGSLKPKGLLVLAFPNLLSFKGIVTKITPFWFHRLFYKLVGYNHRPFPTYLRLAILPKKVIRLADANGFSVAFCRLVEGDVSERVKTRFWFMNFAFSAVNAVVRFISFGKAPSLLDDCCFMILRKRNENS